MTTVGEPKINQRTGQPTMGIRIQVPMKGMSKEITKMSKELSAWAEKRSLKPAGPPFLRYHVIDMAGEMDIEYGIPVAEAMAEEMLPDGKTVRAGALPAGRYASLIYSGSGYTGNKTLIEWASANGLAWDRWDDEKGDAFRSRYEFF